MELILWGVPPYLDWDGTAIKVERGTREAHARRKREGWTGLRLLLAGQPYNNEKGGN